MGTFKVQILVSPSEHEAEFHVMDVQATFNLLLGRPWLNKMRAVSLIVHQLVKYLHIGGIATIFGNSTIHPPPEVQHGSEDVFLSGFSLAEAQLVQTIMAKEEGTHLSAQSVYMMNKLGYIPGSGLGRSGRQSTTEITMVMHNPHAFGLGYEPTVEDKEKKWKEKKERINAKKTGKKYELVYRLIYWTLNGRFVRQGEDFSFCGFLEP